MSCWTDTMFNIFPVQCMARVQSARPLLQNWVRRNKVLCICRGKWVFIIRARYLDSLYDSGLSSVANLWSRTCQEPKKVACVRTSPISFVERNPIANRVSASLPGCSILHNEIIPADQNYKKMSYSVRQWWIFVLLSSMFAKCLKSLRFFPGRRNV